MLSVCVSLCWWNGNVCVCVTLQCLCAHRNRNAFVTPLPPLPKTKLTLFRVQCSRVQCFRWQAIKVPCLRAHRNMNAFVPPSHPCPRLSWLCSGCNASHDRRSRCSACVRTGTGTLLSPPPPPPLPKTKLTLFRVQCSRVQCFRWEAIKVQCLCAHRNRNAFVTPRQPCPRLSWLCSGRNARGCNASDDRPSRCSADDRRWVSDWLVCGWGLCVCVYVWVHFVCAAELDLCAQVSRICVRRWVGFVCVAELDLCAWPSFDCVRRWAGFVCAAESFTVCCLQKCRKSIVSSFKKSKIG